MLRTPKVNKWILKTFAIFLPDGFVIKSRAKLEKCGQFLSYLLLLRDFHRQITGNDNLNKFQAEFM